MPTKTALEKSAKSRESLLVLGADILIGVVDKLTEHAGLQWVVDRLEKILGGPDVSKFVLAHPFVAYVILVIPWIVFVFWRARRQPDVLSPGPEPGGAFPFPNPSAGASGTNPRALAMGGDVTGKLVMGDEVHYHQSLNASVSDEQVKVIMADRNMLAGLRAALPSATIIQLRGQSFWLRFQWDVGDTLLSFLRWNAEPDHRFLHEDLDLLRQRLDNDVTVLLKGVNNYSVELPKGSRDAILGTLRFFDKGDNEDESARDKRRNEVWEAAKRVCETYDDLLLTAHRCFERRSENAGAGADATKAKDEPTRDDATPSQQSLGLGLRVSIEATVSHPARITRDYDFVTSGSGRQEIEVGFPIIGLRLFAPEEIKWEHAKSFPREIASNKGRLVIHVEGDRIVLNDYGVKLPVEFTAYSDKVWQGQSIVSTALDPDRRRAAEKAFSQLNICQIIALRVYLA